MNSVLKYEWNLYFRSWKEYLISRITHEDNYLIWKYVYFLRREEAAANKLTEYYWRRRKNDLGAKLGIIIYAGCCGKGLRIWHYGSTIISGDAKLGENCTFHGQACIGNDGAGTAAPVERFCGGDRLRILFFGGSLAGGFASILSQRGKLLLGRVRQGKVQFFVEIGILRDQFIGTHPYPSFPGRTIQKPGATADSARGRESA